jgi:very-short-patch-repair endonuclease
MSPVLDATLRTVAAGQHGMFTTTQARKAGVGAIGLETFTRAGVLRHPCRGLYAVTALVDEAPEPWHLHLARGAHLLYSDATLTGVTAVLAHGLPVWGADLSRPQLHRPVDRAVGVTAFHIRPRPMGVGRPAAVESPWGATDEPATALVQLALDHGTVPGTVSADAALNRTCVTLPQLVAAAELVRTWPGSNRVRAMLALVDPASESVGETRCRIAMVTSGLQVTSQVAIHRPGGELVARVDFLVTGTRVIVEFDGKVKYADGDPDVLWREKRREDQLRALGYTVVRITWADLERPGAVVAKVRRALAAA